MISNEEVKISVELTEGNRLYAECHNIAEGHTYAFYINKNGEKIESFWYSPKPNCVYWLGEPGEYIVTGFVRNEQGETAWAESVPMQYDGMNIVVGGGKKKRDPLGWLKNVGEVVRDIWVNRARMYRIAQYDYRMGGKDSYLGRIWNVLSPLIQIAAYWFVFGLGIRGGRDVEYNGETIPYLAWMLCGLVPWLFINGAIVRGAGSVYAKATTALRLRYPIATIPAGSILVELFSHIVLLCILFVTLFAYKMWPTLHWLNLIYYVAAAYLMLTALALLTSTLTMIARDFQLLINSLMRLLFFMTPVLWTVENLPPTFQKLLQLNPCLYIIDGFRDSLLYGVNFWERWQMMLYYWGFFLVLLVIGCNAQKRYKDSFLDLL